MKQYQQLTIKQQNAVNEVESVFLRKERMSAFDFVIALAFLLNKHKKKEVKHGEYRTSLGSKV